MRKHLTSALIVLLILSLCSFAQADQAYTVDEINAAISFPDDYLCLSREESKDVAEDLFVENQYLIALSSDLSMEFSLTCLNSSGVDYLSQSDPELQATIETLASQISAFGFEMIDQEIYRTTDNAFVAIETNLTSADSTLHQRQYSTLKSNLYLNLTFSSAAPFTDQHRADMRAIVDSFHWQSASELSYSEMKLEDAGVSFLRPDQWLHEESIENPFTYNSFVTTNAQGEKRIILVTHGNAAPYLARAIGTYDASKMNIGEIDKSTLAYYVIGVDETRLQETEINGELYYRYRMTREEDGASSDVIYQYFHLRNGIIYMFQFDAETDDVHYPVFETLLNSIRYA